MHRDASHTGAALLLLAVGLLGWAFEAAAAEEPLSVTYGPAALTAEGDQDYREIIHLSVPDTTTERLYLRLFDPDVGGSHDTLYGGAWDGKVRYALFGSEDAAPLAELVVGEDADLDNAWETVASFRPDQGSHANGRYVFRLEVTGLSGNDGNSFAATLSTRDRRDAPPVGLTILDDAPTVRVLDGRRATEVAFDIPSDVERIVVRNFDAAAARLSFASTWRSVPLAASGQDEWRESIVELLPEERGAVASVVVAGGQELPNDLTLLVEDEDGRPLPLRLPARAVTPTARPAPVADLTPLADCSTVAFDAARSIDPKGGVLRYLWEFGDGAQAEGVAVVHRYPGPGTYRGTLRVRNDSPLIGNGAALPFEALVKRPPKAVAGDDRVVAPGKAVTFDATASLAGDRPIASYAWDFQDGKSGVGPRSTHAFERPGRYLVTLRVRDDQPGACDSSVDEVVVHVNAPPVAVTGPDRHVAVGEAVELNGQRSYDLDGEVTSWAWDLGDGAEGHGPVVQHAYAAPGTYLVTLTVRDDADLANSAATSTVRVIVNDPPLAEAGQDRTAALGEPLTFNARASLDRDGKLVRYAWDFGDDSQGAGAEVRYAYDRPGTYHVTLSVTDDSGSATATTQDQAMVRINAPPVARAGEDQIVTASEVRFDGSGSSDPDGRIERYVWDFGDGTAGEGAAPTHVYRQPGEYLVRLTVTDDSGTTRNTATDTLRVLVNQAPIADAGPDQLGAPGEELRFSGAGSLDPDGDVAEYTWDFKDGSTASGERVGHRFNQPGAYEVRLTVRDDTGQPDAVDFDEATVLVNAPPVADAGADRLVAPGDAVVLDGANSFDRDGSIAGFRWEFSDGAAPVTAASTTRSYAVPGVYVARLTVTDSSGAVNGIDQDEVTVRVNHAPVASAGRDVLTSSTVVSFDGSASADADGDPLVYRWDFGDGSPPVGGPKVTHAYAEGGTYPVLLTVDDGTGVRNAQAVAAVTVRIDRPPVADAGGNREVCAGDVVVLDGSRSLDPEGGPLRYRWEFGDGTTADVANPTKTYLRGAAYPVTLTVEDDSGFPGNQHTDRVLVRVAESPIADAGPDQLACAGSEVRLDGSASRDSDGVVNRFSWNFGDGATGGGERPVHVFAAPGEYRVVLTIDGDAIGQCPSTSSDEAVVQVVEAPVARIAAPTSVALGAAAKLDASGSTTAAGRIVGWRWDFGDGSTAEGASVEHVFAQAGNYVVTLSLRTEGGVDACREVTAQHSITVNAPPVADAGADVAVAIGEEVLFDAARSTDPDGGIVAYEWDFGDGTTASGINARHAYRASGRYEVRLTVRDNLGLPNSAVTDTAMVTVNQPPMPVVGAPPAACPGEQLAFSAGASRDADGTIASFAWSFGDGASASGPDVTHAFAAPGLYELTLTVDDGTGLANARKQTAVPFRVNRPPQAEAGPDRMVCSGQEIAFDGSPSVDWDGGTLAYLWEFGDGAAAEGARVSHRYAQPGRYEARLTVTDASGSRCASTTDTVRVHVNAPPVIQVNGDREGFVGGAHDQLRFDASASMDADAHPLRYRWELGDGSVLAGDKVRHSYAKPGTYPVRLTVSDSSGLACGQASEVFEVSVKSRD